jgi:hypothetical protein
MYDELERIWKKAVMVSLMYYQGICLVGQKNHRKTSQDSQCPGQDANQAPLKYKSGALPLYQPAQSDELLL